MIVVVISGHCIGEDAQPRQREFVFRLDPYEGVVVAVLEKDGDQQIVHRIGTQIQLTEKRILVGVDERHRLVVIDPCDARTGADGQPVEIKFGFNRELVGIHRITEDISGFET